MTHEQIDYIAGAAREFEDYLKKRRIPLKTARPDLLEQYISQLAKKRRNSVKRLAAIARYCSFTKKNDFAVHLASILNCRNVLPDIGKRIAHLGGNNVHKKVFEGLKLPPLGSRMEDYAQLTHTILGRMETELSNSKCREVLTWNYHRIPPKAFAENKKQLQQASSIDRYLEDQHKRLVEQLTEFMKAGKIWYEQEITPKVIEFVKSNQEICTGIRQRDKIYITKIPYAPKHFLEETDATIKRYYACHCPLVRTSICDGKPTISSTFCHCSCGFEKLHFDVIFGEPVEVQLLESVLKGDCRCRFAVKIPKARNK
jgi:hypothetical protein